MSGRRQQQVIETARQPTCGEVHDVPLPHHIQLFCGLEGKASAELARCF